VEKRRSERDERKAMVASWREGIAKLKDAEVAATGTHEALARTQAIEGTDAPWAPGTDVRFQSWYSTLRNHMSGDAAKEIDQLAAATVGDRGWHTFPELLIAEANRIVKEWKAP
jgi:hypothetical protein